MKKSQFAPASWIAFGLMATGALNAVGWELIGATAFAAEGIGDDASSEEPVFRSALSSAPQFFGAFVAVRPSALGGELGAALLFHPIPGHELLFGPRVGGLVAQGDSRTRFDLNSGVESTLWIVNAIGPGLALEAVAPSLITGEDSAVHFRFVPNLSVRVLRFQEAGAWALRVGVPYDTHYKWGLQLGLTLQLDEVPGIVVSGDR